MTQNVRLMYAIYACNIEYVDFVLLMLADASRPFPCICAIFTCLVRSCSYCLHTALSSAIAVASLQTRSFAQWLYTLSISLTARRFLQIRLKCERYNTYRTALYVITRVWITSCDFECYHQLKDTIPLRWFRWFCWFSISEWLTIFGKYPYQNKSSFNF